MEHLASPRSTLLARLAPPRLALQHLTSPRNTSPCNTSLRNTSPPASSHAQSPTPAVCFSASLRSHCTSFSHSRAPLIRPTLSGGCPPFPHIPHLSISLYPPEPELSQLRPLPLAAVVDHAGSTPTVLSLSRARSLHHQEHVLVPPQPTRDTDQAWLAPCSHGAPALTWPHHEAVCPLLPANAAFPGAPAMC